MSGVTLNTGLLENSEILIKSIFDNRIDGTRFVSTQELAKFFGVSRRTIEGWRYRGLIVPIKIGPKLVRYDLEVVKKWVSARNGGI